MENKTPHKKKVKKQNKNTKKNTKKNTRNMNSQKKVMTPGASEKMVSFYPARLAQKKIYVANHLCRPLVSRGVSVVCLFLQTFSFL